MTQSTTAPGARLLPNAGSGADHRYLRPDGRRVEAQSRRQAVIQLLKEAATRHHLDPSLVLALSYWESAWDESRVSSTGAIGLMQVQPQVAAVDGPLLLARDVDLRDVYDNADLGAAILKANLEAYGSKEVALAAYYQGGPSLEQDGPYPDTQQYVLGILALAAQIAAGQLPS
jgi:soluble lytic murein transglycosylase-like protein